MRPNVQKLSPAAPQRKQWNIPTKDRGTKPCNAQKRVPDSKRTHDLGQYSVIDRSLQLQNSRLCHHDPPFHRYSICRPLPKLDRLNETDRFNRLIV